jgi:hypothetical protein
MTTESGNRRKKAKAIALGSIGALGLSQLLRRRGAALHSATDALTDTVAAPGTHDEPFIPTEDVTAHAAGHRHMAPPVERRAARLAHRAWRRWTPRADHTGHPPRA